MSITFQCSKCSSQYNVKDELAGKKTKCLKCNTILKIPAPQAPKTSDPLVDDDPLGLGIPSPPDPSSDFFKSDPVVASSSTPSTAPPDDGFWSQTSGPSAKESNDLLAEAPISPFSSPSALPSVGSYLPSSGRRGGSVSDAKRQLFWPVLLVRINVLIGIAGSGGLLLFMTGVAVYFGSITSFGIGLLAGFGVLLGILCTAYSGLNNAIKLENKAMAWTGFLLGMPCGFAMPFAVWGMVILAKDEVSRSFRH